MLPSIEYLFLIEHRIVEDISNATIIQTSMVWTEVMPHHEQYTGESSAMFLPMINLDPSDPYCFYTTMQLVSSQYNVPLILTFEQPFYWKALTSIPYQTIGNDPKRIFPRLRGFHMQVSFLCRIGHLMTGSGLQGLFKVVLAGNAIRHMLTGKTISRAVCGHTLTDAALITILVAQATIFHCQQRIQTTPNGIHQVLMPR